MDILIMVVVSLALGVGLAVIWMKVRAKRSGIATQDERSDVRVSLPVTGIEPETISAPIVSPAQVVVTSGDKEVMSMMVLDTADASVKLRNATQLPPQAISGALKSLIEPLVQVAPSAGTAAMANSSKLMEVVINGQLLVASDGNGLRAIAKAGKGFEHARLYEPSNLQNVANAAAIWQIASVVVAQKHLADISETLRRVESKVSDIQDFLEEKRFSDIKNAVDYLEDARKAVESGEFLERTRNMLEFYEGQLNSASMELIAQIGRNSEKALERDSRGCEVEYKSALAKHKDLRRLVDVLTICNETRLANWFLCSVYPDKSKMLAPRLDKIKKRLDEVRLLKDRLSKSVEKDCALIDSMWTSNKTIGERVSDVWSVARNGLHVLQESLRRNEMIVLRLEEVRADQQAINRLIVKTEDGVPSAVYLCQE